MKKTFLRKKIKNKRTLKKRMKGGMWTSPLLGPHPPPLGPAPQVAEMNQSESTSRFDLTPKSLQGEKEYSSVDAYNSIIEEAFPGKGEDYNDMDNFGSLSVPVKISLFEEYKSKSKYEPEEEYGAGAEEGF